MLQLQRAYNSIFVWFVGVATVQWTPEGRRLVTGASSGEFTLWHGLTFSFETILQVICAYEEFNKYIKTKNLMIFS